MSTNNKDIIDKYTFLIMEYIHLVNSSDIINSMEKGYDVFLIGLNALIHIYKISLYATKNVDAAGSYTQKGVYCYLEYIEQMHKTNYVQNIYNIDAISFMYNKTIVEIYGPQTSSESTSISNVLSLNETQTSNCDIVEGQHALLTQLEKITYTLLWLNNPDISYENRIDICYKFLQKYMNILNNLEKTVPEHNIIIFIDYIQQHIHLDYDEYIQILEEFQKQLKKNAKYHGTQLKTHLHSKLIYLVAYFTNKPLALIAEQEGFKNKMDIVKWFFTLPS